jgi:tetratricopeptide (TPR) repeat protein
MDSHLVTWIGRLGCAGMLVAAGGCSLISRHASDKPSNLQTPATPAPATPSVAPQPVATTAAPTPQPDEKAASPAPQLAQTATSPTPQVRPTSTTPAVQPERTPGSSAPVTAASAEARPEAASANDAVAREYQAVLAADDAAQDEVNRMIEENEAFAAKGAGAPEAEMRQRSRNRLEPVRKAYEEFIGRHPDYAAAQVAYGAFLNDLGEEASAQEHLERALTLNPKDPAVYNNLANIYGHIGPVKKSFEYYAKAIELKPDEPVYYHNFGTTVFLFRKDAKEFYQITEQQVFQKALNLYSNAMRLDPDNFPLASDVAQTYYGIRPLPIEPALESWTNAFRIARDDVEREGIQVHFARIKLMAGRFAEAQAHLDAITNATYAELKHRLTRNLEERRRAAQQPGTSPPPDPNDAADPGAPQP